MSERTTWFVESFDQTGGNMRGWFTNPSEGYGGWETTDPAQAKEYTREQATAVADALNYFHAPFRWLRWRATEHVFVSGGAVAKVE